MCIIDRFWAVGQHEILHVVIVRDTYQDRNGAPVLGHNNRSGLALLQVTTQAFFHICYRGDSHNSISSPPIYSLLPTFTPIARMSTAWPSRFTRYNTRKEL